MNTIRKLLALLSPAEKRRGLLVLLAIVMMACVEIASLTAVFGFVRLVTTPSMIASTPILETTKHGLGITTDEGFLVAVGFALLGLLLVKAVVVASTQRLQMRFVWDRSHSISKRLLERYLQMPYSFFLGENAAALSKNLLSEVQQLVGSFLMPLLQVTAELIVAVAIVGVLVWYAPVLAITIFVLFGGVAAIIYGTVQRKVNALGRESQAANEARFRMADHALTGIKDIKFAGSEAFVVQHYERPSQIYANNEGRRLFIGQLPRIGVELLGFGGILVILLYALLTGGATSRVVALTTLYAIAGFRLMPSVNRVVADLTALRFYQPVVEGIHREMVERTAAAQDSTASTTVTRPVTFERAIVFRRVSFAYAGKDPVLRDVDLEIPRGSSLAIVGTTGSGKSTLIDLLLGLLSPTSGEIAVDGQALEPETVRAFRQLVGYVPQHIYLADDTVLRNIAFGVPDDQIDRDRAREAARKAQIDEFIERELGSGYDTPVGDRGIRLSGGQRQRLGIARALYRQPRLLVLDEATSALDPVTEARVVRALTQEKDLTIVMVAHRITTVNVCERVAVIDQGGVADIGSFEEVQARNERFRRMSSDVHFARPR